MNTMDKYIKTVCGYLEKLKTEESKLDSAAALMAETIKNDGLIHIFGTDPHSASAGDELFFMGGGLTHINPLYDPAFSFAHGAYRCNLCQELDGLAPVIMEYYENIKADEPIIIIGSRPDAIVFTQAIEKALAMKLRVIAITSMDGAKEPSWASKVAVLIDNHAPEHDRVLSCGGVSTASVTSILTTAVLNLLTAKTIEILPDAPVWKGNRTGCIDDKPMIYNMINRIKHL